MTVYIKDFRFVRSFGKEYIKFRYFTGYKWKKLKVINDFKPDNAAVFTRYVLKCATDDICNNEADVLKRNEILKNYLLNVQCIEQVNSSEFTGATKLFY